MDAFRRKQWLGIAQRYPAMSPAAQASIQRNMREWARLAPEERKIAREKYKSLKRISPEERQLVKQHWDAYSALTEEEKERLRSNAPTPPKVKTPTKPPVRAKTAQARVATPAISHPRSPISPLKPPENPLIISGGHLPTPPQEEPVSPAAGE